MLKKMIAASACALAALFPLSANAATTVFQEDFNGAHPNGAFQQGQQIGSFVVSAGEIDVLGDLNGNYYGCAGGNNNCVDMNGNYAGSLQASVALVAGDTYRIFFDLAGNGSRPSGVYRLAAGLGSMTPNVFEVPELTGFKTFSFDYEAAASGNAALTFQSLNTDSPGYWGPILDNVRVNRIASASPGPVPEPATWAMMLVGFGCTGLAMRRRGQRTAGIVTC